MVFPLSTSMYFIQSEKLEIEDMKTGNGIPATGTEPLKINHLGSKFLAGRPTGNDWLEGSKARKKAKCGL